MTDLTAVKSARIIFEADTSNREKIKNFWDILSLKKKKNARSEIMNHANGTR